MRELFVEKVIDTTGEFLDNNQRIKLKEILTEICLNYHIEILEQNQKKEIKKNNEEIWDGDLHCADMYYYSKDLKKITSKLSLRLNFKI